MTWYYIDGPRRVGPHDEAEWGALLSSGKITPETLVWHEGLASWTPYKDVVAETEPDEPVEESRRSEPETPEAFAARILEEDYKVDVWGSLARTWGLYKQHFWMLVGATFLCNALFFAGESVPVLSVAFAMGLSGVIFGGLYHLYLRLIRGESAGAGELFAGFRPRIFGQLVLQTLVAFMVMSVCFVPVEIAAKMTGAHMPSQEIMNDPSRFLAWLSNIDPAPYMVTMLVIAACSIPVIYFTFCWIFAVPLIVEKKLRFWQAMRLSRRKVLQHPWRISWFVTIAGLVGIVGFIAFGIGAIFTAPLYFVSLMYLYGDIFGFTPIAEVEHERDEAD